MDLRELCGSNQKTLVYNLKGRKKIGEVGAIVSRKFDFCEKFAKILVSRVTIREKAM